MRYIASHKKVGAVLVPPSEQRLTPTQQTVAVCVLRPERTLNTLLLRDVCADDNTSPTDRRRFSSGTVDIPQHNQIREMSVDTNTNPNRLRLPLS